MSADEKVRFLDIKYINFNMLSLTSGINSFANFYNSQSNWVLENKMKKLVVIIGIYFFAVSVNAALISDLNSGLNHTTIDNSTGITWLRLDQTVNKSIQSLIDTPISGFSVATESQVIDLFSGLLDSDLAAFQSLFGTTGNNPDSFAYYISDDLLTTSLAGGSLDSANLFFNVLITGIFTHGSLSTSSRFNGVFLVQDTVVPVPAPTVIVLFASGLVGLIGTRKNR